MQRGNILEWEQPLVERLKGVPVEVEVNMEPDSILYTTLLLFGSTILLAAIVFGVVIWRVARHGREEVGAGPHTQDPPHVRPEAQSFSSAALTSASVCSSFFTSNARNELAIDRASIRSTWLFTTPSSVTRPRSTMM